MATKFLLGTVLALILLGIGRVRMDVDVLELLPDELAEVQGLQLFLQHFSREAELILLLECDDPEALESFHGSLAAHLDAHAETLGTCLSEAVWSLGSSEELGELLAWLLLNASSPESFAKTLNRLSPDNRPAVLEDSLNTIASSMEFDAALSLAYDPYQLVQALRQDQANLLTDGESFASADGSLRLLIVQAPPGATADYQTTIGWVDRVKSGARAWQSAAPERSAVRLGFTGEPVFEAEIAASMQRDMQVSGSLALLLTAAIFALAYRRLRPLLALMASLTLTFLLTLGLAGWALDSMTVMSVGFASILIGLTVDYGVILYQASLDPGEAGRSPRQLRLRTRKSILWAAATTSAAFAALSFSLVPGIATLGQLVAIGIAAGAVVMLALFPILLGPSPPPSPPTPRRPWLWLGSRAVFSTVALVILFFSASPAWLGFPPLDTSTEALRPRDSAAYEAMDRLENALTGGAGSKLAILTLTEDPERQLDAWEARLARLPGRHTLPRALVSHPGRQAANLERIAPDQLDTVALQGAAEAAGFEPAALDLTLSILAQWKQWKESGRIPTIPASAAAQRLWSRLVATDKVTGQPTHLILSLTPAGPEDEAGIWRLLEEEPDSLPVSWPRITAELNARVPADLRLVGSSLILAVVVMLACTFRRWQEIALSLSVTLLTLLALCGSMGWLGWEWNFFSVGALLLTFGAGLDYSIHILLEQRRRPGDLPALRQGVVRALGVCALSTVAGFASISGASNQGLASLGRICALALTLNALVALILLPHVVDVLHKRRLL